MNDLVISKIEINPINPVKGLVAFASCVLNDAFFIGDIGIHQRLDGSIGLGFPKKKLPNGAMIQCVHPISKEASELITNAIADRYYELVAKVAAAKVSEDAA